MHDLRHRIERLNQIGVALSSENDSVRLLEFILESAQELTLADAGTIYSVRADRTVAFEVMRTNSLGLAYGGSASAPIPFEPLPLDIDGAANDHQVVTHCVWQHRTIRVTDAYTAAGYDFSGTKRMDERLGYRTRSVLTVPMCDHTDTVIGVLQLINSHKEEGVSAFDDDDERLIESLASQAAIAMSHKRLLDQQRALFEAFIRLIADAIDEKSPYTGGHCRRVPELTMMLADAAHATDEGPLADFSLDADQRYALYLASWLHDCGKIVTPAHVMDKGTRLETVHDRIEIVEARFAALRQQILAETADADARARRLESLAADLAFVRAVNGATHVVTDDDRARLHALSEQQWTDAEGHARPLLNADELANLSIPRGTLNPAERETIQHHVVATIHMLEQLPFPAHLAAVVEYAGGHHERVDGGGYPNGLTGAQMSVPARAMAIADVFEALSAADRPYKPARSLNDCIDIMRSMCAEGHLDQDLFEVFINAGIHRDYARRHLRPAQIDPASPTP